MNAKDISTLTLIGTQIFVEQTEFSMSAIPKVVFVERKCHFSEILMETASASTHKNMLRIPGKLSNSIDFRANSAEKMSLLTFK